MADSKVTALTEKTAPDSTDLVYLVSDPGGTPVPRKATLENLRKAAGAYYAITAAETSGGLTDSDLDHSYPPGYESRYTTLTADNSGTTEAAANYTALQAMIDTCAEQKIPFVLGSFYYISTDELKVTTDDFTADGCFRMGGIQQITDSKGTLRFQGDVPNATHIFNVACRGLRLGGAWTAANNWDKGNEPHTGPNETTDTEASPLEFIYCTHVLVDNCELYSSQYDGISMPKDVTDAEIRGNYIWNCQDDGINPGGLPATGGNGVRRINIHDNVVTYCRGTGIHLSASAVTVDEIDAYRCHNNLIYRCGTAGIDFSATGEARYHITDNVVVDIGKPATTDPNYGEYPGPVLGESFKFFISGEPAQGCFGIYVRTSASGAPSSKTVIRGNHIVNLFDRLDNACQGIFVAGGAAALTHSIEIENNKIDLRNRDVSNYPGNQFRAITVGDQLQGDTDVYSIVVRNNTIFGNRGVTDATVSPEVVDSSSTWGRGIRVGATGCVVEGNFISRFGENTTSSVIQIYSDKCRVDGNIVEDCFGCGITIDNSSDVDVVNNYIKPGYDATSVFTGIYLFGASDANNRVRNNRLIDCHIRNEVTGTVISGNDVEFSGAYAVDAPVTSVGTKDNVVINGNKITISSAGADPSNWTGQIINLRGSSCRVTNNQIHRVDTSGAAITAIICTAACDDVIIAGNDIYIEGQAIKINTASARANISNNRISSQTASGNDIEVNVTASLITGNSIQRRGAATSDVIRNTSTAGTSIIKDNTAVANAATVASSAGADTLTNNSGL